jgi:hypothetical protein
MTDSQVRRCAKCRVFKSLELFARKRSNDYQPYCRTCQAEYKKEHYRKNKQRYVEGARRRRDRLIEVLRTAKTKPCADCGRSYPYYVMDFDHRDGEKKAGGIPQLIAAGLVSQKGLLDEIAKCDIVCANCHRERTHRRGESVNKQWRKKGNPPEEAINPSLL